RGQRQSPDSTAVILDIGVLSSSQSKPSLVTRFGQHGC
ncbi:unnamed protein product, partial [Calypogeia fissa]